MEFRQEISGRRFSQSNRLFAGIISALLLAGCTESDSSPDVMLESPQSGAHPASPADDMSGSPPVGLSVDDASIDLPGEVKYPPDSEGDDPAGMIVTGLDALAASQAVSPWLVSVRLFRRASGSSKTGDVIIELTRYAENFPVSAHIRYFSEPLDTCVIRNSENETTGDQTNPPPPGIDGGETVVLNMPSGPWLLLERTLRSDEQLEYRARNPLPGTLPASTMLSIPGGAFPTVAAYPLFETEPVVRLLPAVTQAVSEESRFSWIPLNQQSHVKMDFTAHDEEGDFQGFPVSCWVNDDGSFELPVAVLEVLESLTMQVDPAIRIGVRYSRVYSRLDMINGIVLHQGMEIAE